MSNVLFAQQSKPKISISRDWSVNINGGSTQYWGFINSRNIGTSLKHGPTWGYGVVLSHQFTPVVGISGQFLMGKLKGRKGFDSDGVPANLIYFSDFVETNISAKISLIDLFKGYKPNRAISVYGLAGLGLSNFQGTTTDVNTYQPVLIFGQGQGKGIRGYELEGVGTVGLGLSVHVTKELDFTFENAMKFIDSNTLFEKNGVAHFDLYGYSSIGLSYKFRIKKEIKAAPVVNNNKPSQPKTAVTEKKPEVVPTPAPVKTDPKPIQAATEKQQEIKKEVVATPSPAKAEPVKQSEVKAADPVKQPEVKPLEKTALFSGYKVQIMATMSPASFDEIMEKYNLEEQIREDHVDKWYRYSVGEYDTFNQAYKYKKVLYTRNKIQDSFIVKFEDGKRIGPVWK